jgi:hypothetical protein
MAPAARELLEHTVFRLLNIEVVPVWQQLPCGASGATMGSVEKVDMVGPLEFCSYLGQCASDAIHFHD